MREYRRNMDDNLRKLERQYRNQTTPENRELLMHAMVRAGKVSPQMYSLYQQLLTTMPLVMAVTRVSDTSDLLVEHGLAGREEAEDQIMQNFAREAEQENSRITGITTFLEGFKTCDDLMSLCRCLLLQVYDLIPADKAYQIIEASRQLLTRGTARRRRSLSGDAKEIWDEFRNCVLRLSHPPDPRPKGQRFEVVGLRFLQNIFPYFEDTHIVEDEPHRESFEGEDFSHEGGIHTSTGHPGRRPRGYASPTPELRCYKKVMLNLYMLVLHVYLSLNQEVALPLSQEEEMQPNLMDAGSGGQIFLAPDNEEIWLDEGLNILHRLSQLVVNTELNWAVIYSNIIGGIALCFNLLNRCNSSVITQLVEAKRNRNMAEDSVYQRASEIGEKVTNTFSPYLQCQTQLMQQFGQMISVIGAIDAELETHPTSLPTSMAQLQSMGWPDHLDPANGPITYFGTERRCGQLRRQETDRQISRDKIHRDLLNDVLTSDRQIQQLSASQVDEPRIRNFIADCLAMTLLEGASS